MKYDSYFKEAFGFKIIDECACGEARLTCEAISGNFPDDIIQGVVSALMSNNNTRNRMFTKKKKR
jgi:hypothetical protein